MTQTEVQISFPQEPKGKQGLQSVRLAGRSKDGSISVEVGVSMADRLKDGKFEVELSIASPVRRNKAGFIEAVASTTQALAEAVTARLIYVMKTRPSSLPKSVSDLYSPASLLPILVSRYNAREGGRLPLLDDFSCGGPTIKEMPFRIHSIRETDETQSWARNVERVLATYRDVHILFHSKSIYGYGRCSAEVLSKRKGLCYLTLSFGEEASRTILVTSAAQPHEMSIENSQFVWVKHWVSCVSVGIVYNGLTSVLASTGAHLLSDWLFLNMQDRALLVFRKASWFGREYLGCGQLVYGLKSRGNWTPLYHVARTPLKGLNKMAWTLTSFPLDNSTRVRLVKKPAALLPGAVPERYLKRSPGTNNDLRREYIKQVGDQTVAFSYLNPAGVGREPYDHSVRARPVSFTDYYEGRESDQKPQVVWKLAKLAKRVGLSRRASRAELELLLDAHLTPLYLAHLVMDYLGAMPSSIRPGLFPPCFDPNPNIVQLVCDYADDWVDRFLPSIFSASLPLSLEEDRVSCLVAEYASVERVPIPCLVKMRLLKDTKLSIHPGELLHAADPKFRVTHSHVLDVLTFTTDESKTEIVSMESVGEEFEALNCVYDRAQLLYTPGAIVYPDGFTLTKEACASGIHCFFDPAAALVYLAALS